MWRVALMRVLSRLLPGPRSAAPPDWGARPYRVLFMRHQRVGDLLMATGAIRAIARSHGGFSVDVLASPGSAAVLAQNPYVRHVIVFDRRRWRSWIAVARRLRRARYDVVVDGRVNQDGAFTTTVALMAASRAPLRVGAFGTDGGGIFNLPVRPAADVHFVEQTAATAVPFGVDPSAVDLHPALTLAAAERARAEEEWRAASSERRYAPSGSSESRRVLVNLSVSTASRRWPEDRWIAALEHLCARRPALTMCVTGTPFDAAEVARIAGAVGAAGRTPGLREAMALVATADLLLTPNTGLSHVASAFRTPVVELLPSHHRAFVAYRTPGRSLIAPDDLLSSISLEQVIAALDEVLNGVVATRPSAG